MREEKLEQQSANQPIPDSDFRHSIWTIRAEWIGWFYLLLTIHAAPLIVALCWSENQSGTHDNIASTITTVFSGSASLIFVAATASVLELEVVMVLRHLLEKRDARKERERAEELERHVREERRKDREEGYKEGFEAGRKAEREAQAIAVTDSGDRNGAGE